MPYRLSLSLSIYLPLLLASSGLAQEQTLDPGNDPVRDGYHLELCFEADGSGTPCVDAGPWTRSLVDTGSTGIVVSSDLVSLTDAESRDECVPFEYTSSQRHYAGRLVERNVSLRSDGCSGDDEPILIESQTIFVATHESPASGPADCRTETCGTAEGISMLGVAFDRPERIGPSGPEGQRSARGPGSCDGSDSINPFLRVGHSAGYLLTDRCIVLDFDSTTTSIDLDDFTIFDLRCGDDGWIEPNVQLDLVRSGGPHGHSTDSSTGTAALLIDTGISFAIVSTVESDPPCCSDSSSAPFVIADDVETSVTQKAGDSPFLSFQPSSSDPGSPGDPGHTTGQPSSMRWSVHAKRDALNTGRNLLRDHAYFYDAANGRYGYGPVPDGVSCPSSADARD